MPISDFHASTIICVRAYFGFDQFTCDPEEITQALLIEPDEVRRAGELRALRGGRVLRTPFSDWSLASGTDSKDVNDHIRELLRRVGPAGKHFRPAFGPPSFSVLWKGTYLYAGSGPFYESDVIAGIASLGADLYQDIYQVDADAEYKVCAR
jgi:hypothetical protein